MMFFVISCLLMSAAADKAALRITNDDSKITMGKLEDVSFMRTGPGKLKIESDITTTGTISAASSLGFGRVTRFALDIDGKSYHPKCDQARPAVLKLGQFGGSNNHMGVYVDVKVYGSHRGGYHCGGADASHEVIQWHNCDRHSYRHYVIYGGDKSNSFTVETSGNPKLVNLYDGKTRGDYINVATATGVWLVFEQICGAYLDYTVVLEFHQRSATASGFQLDAGIATKQSISWDSIVSKNVNIPIRGSQVTNANSLVFGQVKRFALDIDGKSYYPKCADNRPALLNLGKFGGSNNHMGSYMDIKVYGSHRGGYHCGGADASHKVAAWHKCDRQSYRHYVVYGGDKTNSFTVATSGNDKLVNLWDGKKRGDYINVATATGVWLVFEQICGAYLDYTVVLEFHHRSATASGFQLDAGIATKQTVTWDSIASSKKASDFPIRSRRRMTEAEAQASLQNEQISQLQREVAELKSLVADLMHKQK